MFLVCEQRILVQIYLQKGFINFGILPLYFGKQAKAILRIMKIFQLHKTIFLTLS